MIDVEVNRKQLEDIEEKFGKETILKMLNTSIKKSVILLERYAIEETPVDEGRLRSGFETEFRPYYGRLFNPVEYAVFVHEGTRPHKAPRNNIALRAERHGLNPGSVWISIMRRGTKANPFMERAVERGEEKVDEIFQREIDTMIYELCKD